MPSDFKPSKNEDEYFLLQDAELIKAQRAKLDAERRDAARKAHHMKCPKCGADLREQEFEHLKVDVCPDCRGMWLDAGEIDLIGKVHDHAVGGFIRDLFKGLRNK
ncbi:MAG: zf-TFIIB domain-containing protein [Gemmatimonadetes bacterium]|nr:zf-TFIIB domain-containing protein [Gemmatimonadota bacterium]